jgi:hypothetical protein
MKITHFTLLVVFVTALMTSCVIQKPETVSFKEPVVNTYTNLSLKKSELFVNAQSWMITRFNNASSVIHYSDKEEGVILGKYIFISKATTTEDNSVYATIDIRVKDNTARISIMPTSEWQNSSFKDLDGTVTNTTMSYLEASEKIINMQDDFLEAIKQKVNF